MSPLDVVAGLGDLTSALAGILAIQDLQQRRLAFNREFGHITVVHDVAVLSAQIGYVVMGVAALAGYVAAAACLVTGHAAHAATALRAVGPLTAYTGPVGKVIGVFQIVAGTMAVIDPDSTLEDRTHGLVRIAWGIPYLVGGAAGFLLSSVVFAVQLDLALLELAGGATKGLVWVELSQCYRRMRSYARDAVEYGNRVMAGQALIAMEEDATRRAYLAEALELDTRALRNHLAFFMEDSRLIDHPGFWKPLRERFRKATPWPQRNPTPEVLLVQAHAVLDTIEQVFTDRNKILDEATLDSMTRHR